jgi:two-component system, NarL family, invasion response regulator UvrY
MIRVLIADDHAILRRGLIEILMRELEGAVCGEAENAQQVLTEVHAHGWDLLLLDVTMPGRSGIDLLGELKRVRPKLPVLVLSVHPEGQYSKRVLKAGASGYMNKDSAPEELIKAIRKVLAGGRYVSAALAEKLALDLREDVRRPVHETLSDRAFEVLRMIAQGKTISESAEELHLSVTTVSTHRARILEKMDMTTTSELMHYALRNSLVDGPRP